MDYKMTISYPQSWWISEWKGRWKNVGKASVEMWKCGEVSSIHNGGGVVHSGVHIVIHRLYQRFMRISTASTITTIY